MLASYCGLQREVPVDSEQATVDSYPQDFGQNGTEDSSVAADRGRTSSRLSESAETTDGLNNYIRSVGNVPLLSKEQTYELARTIEAQDLAFRKELYSLAGTSLELLERWHERREAGHVTAALSAGYRDGSGRDWGKQIDRKMRKLEKLVAERDALKSETAKPAARKLEELNEKILKHLLGSGLSIDIVRAIYRKFDRTVPGNRSTNFRRRQEGQPQWAQGSETVHKQGPRCSRCRGSIPRIATTESHARVA